jgi:hypothetical protein
VLVLVLVLVNVLVLVLVNVPAIWCLTITVMITSTIAKTFTGIILKRYLAEQIQHQSAEKEAINAERNKGAAAENGDKETDCQHGKDKRRNKADGK